MTVTTGSRTSLLKAASTSRAISVVVLPCATSSSTKGVETLPSGRTGTEEDNSGLRQTMMLKASPGPTM